MIRSSRNPRLAFLFFLPLLLAAAVLGGCEDDSPTETQSTEIVLSFTPDPVTAQVSPDPDFDYRAVFTVTITETEGIAGTITSASTIVYAAAGGIIIGTPDPDEDVSVSASASSSRLPANGTATVTFTIDYRLPGDGREALVDVTVVVEDDNDLTVSDTERVSVV